MKELYIPHTTYLHFDIFFTSESEFREIWLQSQFVVLW